MTNNDNKNRRTNIVKLLSILWTQHEDASKNGYLVINGAFIPSPDDNTYHEVNQKLLKDYSLSIFDESLVKNYMNNSTNRYFQLGSGLFKGVAYRSLFLEKDKNGEDDPFLYWKSSLQLKGFINDAITSASALGKTLDEKELKFVDKYIRRIRNRRTGFCVFVIVIILLIIILCICHSNNSSDNQIVNYIKM